MVLRFISMVIGCNYGPYLYLVLPLGGLYLAADGLLLYAVSTALKAFKQVTDLIVALEGSQMNGDEIESTLDLPGIHG